MRRGDEKPCSGSWHCAHELSRDLLTAGSKKRRRPSSTIGSALPFADASRTPVPSTTSEPTTAATNDKDATRSLSLRMERLRGCDDPASPLPTLIETTDLPRCNGPLQPPPSGAERPGSSLHAAFAGAVERLCGRLATIDASAETRTGPRVDVRERIHETGTAR